MELDLLIRKLRRRIRRCPPPGPVSFLKHFPYKAIKKATDGFNRTIYSNSHVAAYKAKFQDGGVCLVKEIKSLQRKYDFYKEVTLLGHLHHRHLLGLKGFSIGHRRFLVFESIDNGSLKEHLNDPLRTPLDWRTRLQIASGVVAALEYLLLFSDPPIYHVSISSSNIILDENFNPKLFDVGQLTFTGNNITIPHASCSEDCMVQEHGNIIFQLGVLILELLTGQSSEEGGADIIQWIQQSHFSSSVHRMIDPDLGNGYDSRVLKNLLSIARFCIKSGNTTSFSVSQIFRYLQTKLDIS